jgi:hypothetical protein
MFIVFALGALSFPATVSAVGSRATALHTYTSFESLVLASEGRVAPALRLLFLIP